MDKSLKPLLLVGAFLSSGALSLTAAAEKDVDVLIVGGGTGGATAAMAAAQNGAKVALIEETDWVGGQFTSQGLPAPDEHHWIEKSCSRSYGMYRQLVRSWYQLGYNLSDAALAYSNYLDPGDSWVTPVGHEPKVANWAFEQLFRPAIDSRSLEILTATKVTTVSLSRPGQVETVTAVTKSPDGKETITIFKPKYVVEATLLGDFFVQAQVPFNVGVESIKQTGEPNAYPGDPDPTGVQGFTYCFIVEYRDGEKHTIEKPAMYDKFKKHYKLGKFNFRHRSPENESPFWQYRRLLSWRSFDDERIKTDVAVINWGSNDYCDRDLINASPEEREEIHNEAKQQSLGFLYWLQTECPRDPQDGGGKGYPELKLRTDMLGTTDGLAMQPYIRESRRLRGIETIKQDDITSQPTFRAKLWDDSVGIGYYYMIDIHACVGDKKRTIRSENPSQRVTQPYQIPLGALISEIGGNVLAGQKNLSVTHVTNGTTRLHPVEWHIGEAAGTLAAMAVKTGKTPTQIRNDKEQLRTLQRTLIRNGVPIFWYGDLSQEAPEFQGAQRLAVEKGWVPNPADVNFRPTAKLTKKDLAFLRSAGMEDLTTTFTRGDVAKEYQKKDNIPHGILY